jgi:hypothetical protein
MHVSTPDTGFVLLIERGQTRFPERPIDVDRFLIGAGSNCHLQLGGDMPILHSIIIPEGDHLWIDAVVPVPALVVNGKTVRESELRQGDVIEIAGFVFSVGYKHPAVAAVGLQMGALASQSAAQLVAGLEQELNHLAAIDIAREQGAAALLQAAAMIAQTGGAKPQPAQVPSNWDQAVATLLDELKARARALELRESALTEFAQQLEKTQQELERQLSLACEQLQPVTEEGATSTLRMTA